MSSEFTEANCKEWGLNVSDALQSHQVLEKVAPILGRLEKEPEFALEYLRWSFVSQGIIAFTSGVEFFLQDIVKLCLIRNSNLRRKGFADLSISALDLEEMPTLDEVKLKYIEILANQHTSGKLFSHKYKKSKQFLGIRDTNIDESLCASLDSIWEVRNQIAHENQAAMAELKIKLGNGLIKYSGSLNKSQYQQFTIHMCTVFDDAVVHLEELDKRSLEIWPAKDFLRI
ncbi:MAG: hypothetical protein SFU83_23950 [Meiothermus sp.]|nr:hypothetical protein [Meiothermus sp.]